MPAPRAAIVFLLLLVLAPIAGPQVSAQDPGGEHMIVGFLPYWMVSSFNPEGKAYTDIVFFSAPVRDDGSLDLSWVRTHQADLERIREECGCRIHLAVTLFDRDAADKVLAYHRIELANNIRSAALSYGFDGVNIDFEMMRDTNKYTGEDNTDYMIDVLSRLQGSGLIIGIDVMGSVEKVWRDPRLSSYVDYVFLMGYDYHYAGSRTTGPVSPLESGGLSLEWSINKLLEYYPASKIILGLPLYGYDWPADSCSPGARTLGAGKARTLRYIENSILPRADQHWDPEARSPWASYHSGGTCRQVWYENATSIAIKADYALSRGLLGFGFWALGYESGSRSEDAIDMLVESRRAEPGVGTVRVVVDGSTVRVIVENASYITRLRVSLPVGGGVQALSTSGGDFPLAGLSAHVDGGVLVVEANASEPFPGYGIKGTGLLAVVNLTGEPSPGTPTAEAWAARFTTSGGTTLVPAIVGNVVLEAPGGQPPGGGSPGGGGHRSAWTLTYTPPVRPTGEAPFLGAGVTGLAAVLAAIVVGVFLLLLKTLF